MFYVMPSHKVKDEDIQRHAEVMASSLIHWYPALFPFRSIARHWFADALAAGCEMQALMGAVTDALAADTPLPPRPTKARRRAKRSR